MLCSAVRGTSIGAGSGGGRLGGGALEDALEAGPPGAVAGARMVVALARHVPEHVLEAPVAGLELRHEPLQLPLGQHHLHLQHRRRRFLLMILHFAASLARLHLHQALMISSRHAAIAIAMAALDAVSHGRRADGLYVRSSSG